MPRGYDALRDVLASKYPPIQLKPDIRNLLNNDPIPQSPLQRLLCDPHSPVLDRTPPVPSFSTSSPTTRSVNSPPPSLPSTPHMPPVAIPYKPITRRSPATTVLVPLTPTELESFKAPRHALRVRAKRPDPALENPHFFPSSVDSAARKRKGEEMEEERAAKRSRLVVEHCAFS